MSELIKQEMTVQWIVNRIDKKSIKFVEGENKTYKLADNLQVEEIVKRKINVPVNVTIENDIVVYIAIRGEEAKIIETSKEEKSVETKKQEDVVEINQKVEVDKQVQSIHTYKVKGYSKDMLWWLFEETGEKVWFGVDDKMIPFMRNIKKGDILKISGESRDSRGKDVDFITYAELVTKSTENTNPDNVQPKKGSYSNDSDARAKNTAIMIAKDIIVAYINSKAEKVNTEEKVEGLLKQLTKVCYEVITAL
jgi:hypothetical protein